MAEIVLTDQNLTFECENIMNMTIETRKQFGKLSTDYEQKSMVMENKILNKKVEAISNCRFKPKLSIPETSKDEKEIEDFIAELKDREKSAELFEKYMRDLQTIATQLEDVVGYQGLDDPVTTEALLARAREKHAQ